VEQEGKEEEEEEPNQPEKIQPDANQAT